MKVIARKQDQSERIFRKEDVRRHLAIGRATDKGDPRPLGVDLLQHNRKVVIDSGKQHRHAGQGRSQRDLRASNQFRDRVNRIDVLTVDYTCSHR